MPPPLVYSGCRNGVVVRCRRVVPRSRAERCDARNPRYESIALQLAAALQRVGKPYELVIVEGAEHVLNPYEAERDDRASRWFRRHLAAAAQ
jgi:hypothetical protein